jgi:hypothetical protein
MVKREKIMQNTIVLNRAIRRNHKQSIHATAGNNLTEQVTAKPRPGGVFLLEKTSWLKML